MQMTASLPGSLPFDSIFQTIASAVVIVDRDMAVRYMNHDAERITGISFDKCQQGHVPAFLSETTLKAVMDTGQKGQEPLVINGFDCHITHIPIREDSQVKGAVVIIDDVTVFKRLDRQLKEGQHEISILKHILETAYDGLIVTDANARITMISNAYKQFLGVTDKDVIGRHVTEVVENTRMHIVAQTGVAEINDVQRIKGNYMVASRIPYHVNGKLAGVIGKVIIQNVDELGEINKKLRNMEMELNSYRNEISKLHKARYDMEGILTCNAKMTALKQHAALIAQSDSNVLILGESGTGKELLAHAIHRESRRCLQPFIKVNCAAIPEHLLESELFGYEKGAFTGATSSKMGKFELANHGSIFLDEIGDMPLQMQAKILRVLQEGELEHIGDNRPRQVDVRVIAATNKSLAEMVEKKLFREDLLYRLNVFTLTIPPLRHRQEDVGLIAEHMICRLNHRMGPRIKGVSAEADCLLQAHRWPGNIRELKNVVERAYHVMEGEEFIQPWHLPKTLRKGNVNSSQGPLKHILESTERNIIAERLVLHRGNKTKTAANLGISRVALHKKLLKYGLK